MLKNIVITAGGTSERIDNVRTLTNMSTGKLGATICNCILERIPDQVAKIYYICSEKSIRPIENEKIEFIFVRGANDLKDKVESLLLTERIDFFVHSMAVSDYTTDYVSSDERLSLEISDKVWDVKDSISKQDLYHLINEIIKSPSNTLDSSKKMSSSEKGMIIKLKQTPKVISIIKQLQPSTKLIGFKLLSDVSEQELISVASELLRKNDCDYVVANDLANIKSGEHKAILLSKSGEKIYLSGKDEISVKITDLINC